MAKEIKGIQDLLPDQHNANRGTERGRYMLEKSLEDVGAGRSIVVDRDGKVIAGNKTLEAWAEMGGEIEVVRTDGRKLVVVQRDDLDLDDPTGPARRLAYFDNRVAEVSLDWDAEELFSSLNEGVDLGDMFFDYELSGLLGGSHYKEDMPDVEFKEYDESVANEVEMQTCPNCGHSFPK